MSQSASLWTTLATTSPRRAISGQNVDIWGSCREEAQKVTWEVMQELEAWELLPEDFLMPLREHACSLKVALQKDSKAGGSLGTEVKRPGGQKESLETRPRASRSQSHGFQSVFSVD